MWMHIELHLSGGGENILNSQKVKQAAHLAQ